MRYAVLIFAAVASQQHDQDQLLTAARQQAQAYARWYAAGDFQNMGDQAHPTLLKLYGGKDKYVEQIRRTADNILRIHKVKLVAYDVLETKQLHKAGKSMIAVFPTRLRVQAEDGRYAGDDHLIVSTSDGGKTWHVGERTHVLDSDLREMYPDLLKPLNVPLTGRMVEDVPPDVEPRVLSSTKANFRLTAPKGWRKALGSGPDYQIVLAQRDQLILIGGEESNRSAEELLNDFLNSFKSSIKKDKDKDTRRDERKVAGESAFTVRLELERAKASKDTDDVWITTFQHQGIIYRVLGFGPKENSPNLEKDYLAVLDAFAFLAERKEWLAINLGKPRRTAFLAGLASLELNRPRWLETTFEERGEFGALETLRFKANSGNAWITVLGYDQRASAKAELEELQQFYALRLDKFQAKRVLAKGPKGFQSAVEMTGNVGSTPFVVLGTVVVRKDLAAHLTLECPTSQRGQFQKDWEQLVREFRLEDAAAQPPLFPLRPADLGRQRLHPVLTALLKKSTPVYTSQRLHDVQSISADGQQALVIERGDWLVESLVDRKRTALPTVQPRFGTQASWSRDGKQIAYATYKGVGFHTFGTRTSFDVPLLAASLAFLPDDRLLVATQAGARPSDDDRPIDLDRRPAFGQQFVQQRLMIIEEGEKPKALLEFPLARFAHLAVSPDGKQLALVTNKDLPRTAPRAGNLYLAQPDGTGLRRLTKDAELIRSVAWSDDGRFLYVVRRLLADKEGPEQRPPFDKYTPSEQPGDLYRISVETSEAVNLTRCGKIDQAWVQGGNILLRISTYDISLSQVGIFKVPLADLARISAQFPEPKLGDVQVQARHIADRLKAAFAPRRLQEVVPTIETLDKLARVFAEAASHTLGEPFDFSAASLDRLPHWADWLEPGIAGEPALIYGLGAYYGETLRKLTKSQWRLAPLPLGDWLPARGVSANAVAHVVLPFSEAYRYAIHSDVDFFRGSEILKNTDQTLVLVYPPALADRALQDATSKAYRDARAALDGGDIKKGADLLIQEVRRQPHNATLALQTLQLCEVARLPELADLMAQEAVEAGSDVPELLLRHADTLAKSDPDKALTHYRKAAQAPYVPPETYIKLGKQLNAQKQQPLADCCFRKAYLAATDVQRDEIRRLLDLGKLDRFARP
jgi:hypothetical protein